MTSAYPIRPVRYRLSDVMIQILILDASGSGTFWYHSHLSTQYCDGLRGPLVVYDPLDPLRILYDVDDGK